MMWGFHDDSPLQLNPKPFALFIFGFCMAIGALGVIAYRGPEHAHWWVWPILVVSCIVAGIGVAGMVHEKEDFEEALEDAEEKDKQP